MASQATSSENARTAGHLVVVAGQKNLEGIMATRGAPAVSAVSEEHYGPAAGNFMAGITDMQAAFESLNHAGSDFQ